MTMKTAVVFDSAGTLLKVYRVAKDVRKGIILENVASTNIVALKRGCALVALKVDTFEFLDGMSPGTSLTSYIKQAGIGLDVICRSSRCSTERIETATLGDTLATIGDMQDAIAAVKLKCKDIYYVNMGFIVDVPRATILYVLATGGRIFSGVKPMIDRLRTSDADVYIASGDNRRSLSTLAAELGIPESQVFDALQPAGKRDLVLSLKRRYDRVVMVGDGINDRLALEAADVAILTVQQEDPRPPALYDSADAVVYDIRDVEGAIKKSLHSMDCTNS
ncbi:MAG: Soluble P-type ATPase-like phosphatase [Methanocella sp. PtaU1.Bin125]|nr:MAG: Soluble P-type ATPase-like phosphatase [Methanocella sp. PtaU1.Bin125]